MRRGSLVALALGLLLAAGCGEEKAKAPPATAPSGTPAAPAATLLVTRGFGGEVMGEHVVAPGQDVLVALQGVADVETAYGGRFVQAVDGVAGSAADGVDWFYFLNGVEGDRSAAEVALRDGDVAWWDHRRWSGRRSVPAVVGAWPEPFVRGPGGGPPRVRADDPLGAVLARRGATLTDDEGSPWRVRVGADAELRRRDAAWRRAAADPAAYGLTAWIAGARVRVWDAAAGTARDVPDAVAVVAAAPTGDVPLDGSVLVVAGLDAGAARGAAAAVARDPGLLAHRYALCLGADGRPRCAGGVGVLP